MQPGIEGQPGLEESPVHLRRWIGRTGVDPASVARVVEGIELSARGERPGAAHLQRSEVFIPGLAAQPWWDRDRFPWLADLEVASADITTEFESVGGLVGTRTLPQPSDLTDRGRWTALYLYCIGKAYAKNVAACPKTVSVLQSIPGLTGTDGGMCYFSIMDPYTHVAAHTGHTNAHLRCHLALVAPPGSRIRVAQEAKEWEPGKAFVFDDSFEHEAWNDSGSGRAVLLFDIWHPDLTEPEIRALSYLMGVWRRLVARRFWSRQIVGATPAGDLNTPA